MKNRPPLKSDALPMLKPGDLAPGDIVRLASGGPQMTVVFIKDSLMPTSPIHGPVAGDCVDARCAWFSVNGPNSWQGPNAGDFSVCLLTRIEARGGVAPQPVDLRPPSEPPPPLALVQPDVEPPKDPINEGWTGLPLKSKSAGFVRTCLHGTCGYEHTGTSVADDIDVCPKCGSEMNPISVPL